MHYANKNTDLYSRLPDEAIDRIMDYRFRPTPEHQHGDPMRSAYTINTVRRQKLKIMIQKLKDEQKFLEDELKRIERVATRTSNRKITNMKKIKQRRRNGKSRSRRMLRLKS